MSTEGKEIVLGVLVFSTVLLAVALGRGVRRHYRPSALLDESLLGLVAVLVCIGLLVEWLKIPAGIGCSALLARFLWIHLRKR
jgi:hypothetical protein